MPSRRNRRRQMLPMLCVVAAAATAVLTAHPAVAQAFAAAKHSAAGYLKARLVPHEGCQALSQYKAKDLVSISATAEPAAPGVPAHCRVTGTLAPEIAFEVSLPQHWNGRFYMIGNGGHAGESLEDANRVSQRNAALQAGFAFAQTNTGHDARREPGASFVMSNPEKAIDYAYRAVNLTAVTAKDITQAYYGRTPTALLDDSGALTPRTTVVHATHLSERDIRILGDAGVTACFCPTTEQDLADGIGPARALADAGARLSLGSDQNAVVDLIGEARALESGERLASRQRGRFRPDELLAAATAHDSLGWPDAGTIAPGMRADLVCIRSDTVRTAGADPAQILLAATAADIDSVWVDGSPVVSGGAHRLGDVAGLLADAIGDLWADA